MKSEFICLAVLALGISGIASCRQSDWFKDQQAADAAAERAARTPHVIREADGCKVYAFKLGDRDHYFTRCKDKTTTESSHTVPCGKNCSREEVETVDAENAR